MCLAWCIESGLAWLLSHAYNALCILLCPSSSLAAGSGSSLVGGDRRRGTAMAGGDRRTSPAMAGGDRRRGPVVTGGGDRSTRVADGLEGTAL